mmetsp:Transcript_64059/g.119047  ORF Transcript_64059/g.119047 Transcript_64059/m.119047 type:complete len:283 (-) Transcript_64059:49-897(-)
MARNAVGGERRSTEVRRTQHGRVWILRACLAVVCLRIGTSCFVSPPQVRLMGRRNLRPARHAAEQKEKSTAATESSYEPYDWQKAANLDTSASRKGKKVSSETDGADASGKKMDFGGGLADLPDLPFESDLVPPEPKGFNEGGRDLFEWTGIWVTGFVLLGLVFGAFSVLIAKAGVDAEFAEVLSRGSKAFIFLFEALFMGRIILQQFPKTKTTDMPWALVHYPTEWILVPTRGVFPPEAGVDVSPIFWFVVLAFTSEFLNGPAGVLTLIQEGKLDVITGKG